MSVLLRRLYLTYQLTIGNPHAKSSSNHGKTRPLTHSRKEDAMKSVILAMIAIAAGLVSACTVRTERTVVERPAPAQTATVVYADPPPTTTVYVGP